MAGRAIADESCLVASGLSGGDHTAYLKAGLPGFPGQDTLGEQWTIFEIYFRDLLRIG